MGRRRRTSARKDREDTRILRDPLRRRQCRLPPERAARHREEQLLARLLIDSGLVTQGRLRLLAEQAREIAESNGWRYDELPGDPHLIRKLIQGEWPVEDFLIVPPGARIEPSYDGSTMICFVGSGLADASGSRVRQHHAPTIAAPCRSASPA